MFSFVVFCLSLLYLPDGYLDGKELTRLLFFRGVKAFCTVLFVSPSVSNHVIV